MSDVSVSRRSSVVGRRSSVAGRRASVVGCRVGGEANECDSLTPLSGAAVVCVADVLGTVTNCASTCYTLKYTCTL